MTALRLTTLAAAIWAALATAMLVRRVPDADERCPEEVKPTPLAMGRLTETTRARAPSRAPPAPLTAPPAPSAPEEPLRLPCLTIVPSAPEPVPALSPDQQRDLDRCRAGSAMHCRAIQATFDEKHPALATEASRLSCAQGRKASCAELGRRVARGLGVDADFDAGVGLMREACAAEPRACFELTLELRSVLPDEAFEAARRGCATGRAIQCKQAGELALRGAGGSTPLEAAAWYDSACERGSHDGCKALFELSESGRLGPVDATLLLQRRRRACAVGLRAACLSP